MASGEKETIWEADPHTFPNLAILDASPVAYWSNLEVAARRGQELLDIVGFAKSRRIYGSFIMGARLPRNIRRGSID